MARPLLIPLTPARLSCEDEQLRNGHLGGTAMSRWMLIALLGLFTFTAVGCDDDDAEIETPAGKIEIDR